MRPRVLAHYSAGLETPVAQRLLSKHFMAEEIITMLSFTEFTRRGNLRENQTVERLEYKLLLPAAHALTQTLCLPGSKFSLIYVITHYGTMRPRRKPFPSLQVQKRKKRTRPCSRIPTGRKHHNSIARSRQRRHSQRESAG